MENKNKVLATEYNGITLKHPVKREEDLDLIKTYIDNGKDIEAVIEKFGYNKKKAIGKLVAFGVYEKQEKQIVEKKERLGKKELITKLEEMLNVDDFSDLTGAKISGLNKLIDAIEAKLEDESDVYSIRENELLTRIGKLEEQLKKEDEGFEIV